MIRYTYDHELMTMSTMFLNSMSDIVVKRFNVHKEARDQIKTRIVYAPKQRVLNDLLDRDQNIQLPVISCYIGGIARDEGRVFNKILGTFHTPAKGSSSINQKGPLPIDVTYNVTIMTRYQQDMDQILSHLLPYVNPYFVVSWRTPNRQEHEIRSNVFWSGNVNIQYPFDLAATQVARVVADTSFTFKGWLFPNSEEVSNVHTFHTTFTNNITNIPMEYSLDMAIDQSAEATSYVQYKAAPPQPKTIKPDFAHTGVSKQFTIYGAGFEQISNVYLSGAPFNYISTLCNPFSSVPLSSLPLSANALPFFGVRLLSSDWSSDNIDTVTFVMPSANSAGRVDVILEGPVGYGKLTDNVRINDYNPFDPLTPEYNSFIPYQMPYLSGIQVFGS